MEVLGKTYLRVKTPVTTDGVNTKIVDDRLVYRTDFLPLSARKHLEAENAQLPDHLKHKIEVVDENAKPPIPENKIVKDPQPPAAMQTASEDDEEFAKIPEPTKVQEPAKVEVAPKKRKK